MERIGFDARMLEHTGIGTYIKNLLAEYDKIGFTRFITAYGDKDDAFFKGRKCEVVNAPAPVYSFSEQLFFALNTRKCDRVFHSPHYNAPVFSRRKLAATIHDLTHLKMPEHLPSATAGAYAWFMLKAVSRRASRIITSSESVKSDIIKILGAREEKIHVIPLAAGSEFMPLRDEEKLIRFRRRHNLPDRFILHVGNMKKHKNLDVLLEAYGSLAGKGRIDAGLVFATAGRPDRELILKAREGGLGGKVFFLPFLPGSEMPLLYNSAELFVFPSLSEGFGLPVLEALACGVPCAASGAASVPEVAGEAAVICDPRSPGEFEKAIHDIMTTPSLRESLSRKGPERARLFSWERTAAETINVYKSI